MDPMFNPTSYTCYVFLYFNAQCDPQNMAAHLHGFYPIPAWSQPYS